MGPDKILLVIIILILCAVFALLAMRALAHAYNEKALDFYDELERLGNMEHFDLESDPGEYR